MLYSITGKYSIGTVGVILERNIHGEKTLMRCRGGVLSRRDLDRMETRSPSRSDE